VSQLEAGVSETFVASTIDIPEKKKKKKKRRKSQIMTSNAMEFTLPK
jgi:hypothetical protein